MPASGADPTLPPLRLLLFGPLEVWIGDWPLPRLRARKSPWLLSLLVLRQGAPLEREWLSGILWPERVDRQALRNSLTELRQALGLHAARLFSPTSHTLAFDLSGAVVDVLAFDAAMARGDLTSLAEAVELYRGPLLEGCTEEWSFQERQLREQEYLAALERLAAKELACGDWARAESYLRRAEAVDPLRESSQRVLMEALAAGGNYATALLTYRELRLRLHRELNTEPDPETRALFERLRAEARRLHGRRSARSGSRPTPPSLASSTAAAPKLSALPTSQERTAQRSTTAPARIRTQSEDTNASRLARPGTTLAPLGGNVPRRLTRFFGRQREIERLCALVRDEETALVSLTGPGGSGKTTLAMETARQLQAGGSGESAAGAHGGADLSGASNNGRCAGAAGDPRSDGAQALECWFVPLLDLADPALILERVRDELRLPHSPLEAPLAQIVAALSTFESDRGRQALLVLDNFEHLVDGGAEVVRTLLERVAGLTVVVTSRRRLDLPGEREFPVAPLPTPGVRARARNVFEQEHENGGLGALLQCPSVALFVDRAQAVRPEFQVTTDNADAVASLCRRLEGLPLAIELAAARANVLTPVHMLERLESTLPSGGTRFELLAGKQRSAHPRHRSLRATLDWSFELLAPEVRQFFARLSIFRGGWTLGACEAVCEEPRALEYLDELQQCSLVVAEPDGEAMRYRMLETLREYGEEQLTAEERVALAQKHLAFYLAWTAETGPELGVRFEVLPEWLDQAEREQDNLRGALGWMLRGSDALDWLLRAESNKYPALIVLLVNFWQQRGHQTEGRRWLAQILARPEAAAHSIPRAYLLHEAGAMAYQQGDLATADALVQESLAICVEFGTKHGESWCCGLLALVARDQGDYGRARAYRQRTVALSPEIGEEDDFAWAIAEAGYLSYLEGDLETAQPLLAQGLQMLRSLGKEAREGIAWASGHMGEVADARGDYAAAQAHLDECMALMRELRSLWGCAYVRLKLGRVAQHQAQWSEATAQFCESLAFYQRVGNLQGIVPCLEGLGAVAAGQGDPERAARLLGAAAALREGCRIPLPPIERPELDRVIAGVRAALGEAAFGAAWAHGRVSPLDRAVTEALQAALAD